MVTPEEDAQLTLEMWHENACLDNTCALAFFQDSSICVKDHGDAGIMENFKAKYERDWEDGPFILIQQDNLKSQNEDNIKRLAFCNDASIYNTCPNCTDCEALIDHTLRRELKNGIRDIFWGTVKTYEKWIGEFF